MLSDSYLARLKDISLGLFDPDFSANFHVAFIISKGRILAIATNSNKTNPTNLLNRKIGRDGNDISFTKRTCAEFNVMRRIKNTMNIPFSKTTLVSVRVKRDKRLGMARPCSSCVQLLEFFGLKNVIYTDNQGNFVYGS